MEHVRLGRFLAGSIDAEYDGEAWGELGVRWLSEVDAWGGDFLRRSYGGWWGADGADALHVGGLALAAGAAGGSQGSAEIKT